MMAMEMRMRMSWSLRKLSDDYTLFNLILPLLFILPLVRSYVSCFYKAPLYRILRRRAVVKPTPAAVTAAAATAGNSAGGGRPAMKIGGKYRR